jgi:hypothetical protein
MWFMLCTVYVFILALRQAGFNWLIIFSLSGYLALLLTLLVCLYLFAIFRGASSAAIMQKEHPLTSTMYYMTFYVSTPFLGALAGILGMWGERRIEALSGAMAMGTIAATFLTWIVVDGVASSVELLTPQARQYRAERLAEARRLKQHEQTSRERLLNSIRERKSKNERLWRQALALHAGRLAKLLACDNTDFSSSEQEAIELGVKAWRMGGLSCMRYLRNMAMEEFKRQYNQRQPVDYICAWWDGIGRWRNPSLVAE